MQQRWIGIITALKRFSFVLQMLLNDGHLIRRRTLSEQHALHATGVRHAKNVDGLSEVKRHYVMPHVVNVVLLSLSNGG